MVALLYWLLVGHVVADFWAQTEGIAKLKNRHRNPMVTGSVLLWPYALTAHAAIHGAFVTMFTGSIALGIVETCAHWFIDFGKCEGWYGIHVDQAAHVLCKIAYVLVAVHLGWVR